MFFVLIFWHILLRDELYVMLMLMRSEGSTPSICEDTDVKVICAVEAAAEEYKDCPVACRAEANEPAEDVVVKSGDLAVTAKAAEGRKVLKSGISDLDTLTFSTSEEVEISKIELELYGYTADSNTIKGVWLEDADGNVIADAKTLTKDKVTLAIKKDYRKVDGKFVATIVVETENAEGTLGFKVVKDGVVSTAANLNVDDYTPYTYEVIAYQGSTVTIVMKGSAKNYNYEEGNSYEIARFKVTAGTKDALLKGFTLTNKGKLDMGEFLDKLTVTVDGKEIKANASVNKDEELVVSFDDIAIKMNKSALFVLSASFADFDDYGESVEYYFADTADFNAVESKNGTRVQVNIDNAKAGYAHAFNGGKIKLSNTKLGNVDAAQASEGNVVAEGNVTVTEPISKLSFAVVANENAQYIDALTLVVDGEDYESDKIAKAYSFTSYSSGGTCQDNEEWATGKVRVLSAGANSTTVEVIENSVLGFVGETFTVAATTLDENMCYELKQGTTVVAKGKIKDANEYAFGFKNVSIEKSGKVQFMADIKDDPNATAKVINFTSNLGKAAFEGARYENSNKDVSVADVAGSITFSKVTIQAAKASMENKLTKAVEFLQNETSRKVVFDGTYTAKKGGAVDLDKFAIVGTAPANGHKVTFYLSIDGEEVADNDLFAANVDDKTTDESFSPVRVEAGKSVSVKVEAEVEAYGTVPANGYSLPEYTVVLRGTDLNGNEDTGKGTATLVSMKIKTKGSVTIPSSAEDKTAILRASNKPIAKFTVKPSNGNEGIMLEDLKLSIQGKKLVNDVEQSITLSDLIVKVAGIEYDYDETDALYPVNEELPTEGLVVEVTLKPEAIKGVILTVDQVNGKDFGNQYSKYFVDSLVKFVKQDEGSSSTEYTLSVEHADDAYSVTSFNIYATCDNNGDPTGTALKSLTSISDEETFTIMRGANPAEICAVSYTIAGGAHESTVTLTKKAYKDYFKVGGKELAVPAK